jgi:hypothetical protein
MKIQKFLKLLWFSYNVWKVYGKCVENKWKTCDSRNLLRLSQAGLCVIKSYQEVQLKRFCFSTSKPPIKSLVTSSRLAPRHDPQIIFYRFLL